MKTSKLIFAGLSALIIMLLISDKAMAQWGRGVRGNGNVVKQERKVGDFSTIKLNCSVDLFISQGTTNSVTVKAEDNLLDMIETEVSGDALKIDIDGSISTSKEMVVFVTVANLHSLQINGSGDVKSENTIKGMDLDIDINGSGDVKMDLDVKNVATGINGSGDVELSGVSGDFRLKIAGSGDFDGDNMRLNLCEITVYGSGDVRLSGSASNVELDQSASGDINLYNLEAQDLTARSNGSGDIVVSVSGIMNVKLSGSGDLTYKGNPAKVDVSATGSGDVYHR